MSLRYVLGSTFAATKPETPTAPGPFPGVPATPAAPAKSDPTITLGDVDSAAWNLPLTIPAYDLATSNKLVEVRLYLAPSGSELPTDAAGWLASTFPVQVIPVGNVQTGASAPIPLPDVPVGVPHLGQAVLGYDA